MSTLRATYDLINAGKYAQARTSLERLVADEGALGMKAEELVEPLRLLAASLHRASLLDDAHTVMMRALTLSEKPHGEEGLITCGMRSVMGEPLSAELLFSPLRPPALLDLFSLPNRSATR